MATIHTGVLLKTKGSVGGVNFYERNGVQCLRNKPQRSENYVSSPAQRYQQSVFKAVSEFIKTSYAYTMLVRGGWGASKKGKGRTAYNNFSSEVLRKLSRNSLNEKLSQADYETNVDAFNSNPGKWLRENIALTMSKFGGVGNAFVLTDGTLAGEGADKLTISVDVVNQWLSMNARQYGTVDSPNEIHLFLSGDIVAASSTEWFIDVKGSKAGDQIEFTLPAGINATAKDAIAAIAFFPAASGNYGAPLEPAVSQAVAITL